MKTRQRVVLLGLLLGSLTPLNATDSRAAEPGDLRAAGTVDFPVSCKPAAQPEFIRGVALLHSFFYEEARRSFTAAAEKDPGCAMAQWGIAMTWWHPDLDTSDSRRNERGQGGRGQGHGNEVPGLIASGVYHRAQCLLQHAGGSGHGRDRAVLPWAGRTARSRGRV